MFEDENERHQNRQRNNNNGYISAKDALTNNSAVKAALFVAGLMVCVIVVYVFLMGNGLGATPSDSTGTSGASTDGTADPDSTADPNDTLNPDDTGNPNNTGNSTGEVITPTPTAAETTFNYKKGDSNPKIQEIQQELKNKKYLDASVQLNNALGEKTEAAIKLLQSDLNLTPTGIIDNALYDQLKAVPERFVLKKGEPSEKVKALQVLLIQKGYLDMKAEEAVVDFGPKTETAVKLFQKDKGLKETGEVTSVLYQMLETAPVRNAG